MVGITRRFLFQQEKLTRIDVRFFCEQTLLEFDGYRIPDMRTAIHNPVKTEREQFIRIYKYPWSDKLRTWYFAGERYKPIQLA
jgi:hypothetical protein